MHQIRLSFDAKAGNSKKKLLAKARKIAPDDPEVLIAYHDTLLFMAAYPDDAEMLKTVNAELERVAAVAGKSQGRSWERALADTGIGGTRTTSQFTIRIARWLSERFGGDVELDWSDDEAVGRLEEFLPRITTTVEGDGLRNERYDTRAWAQMARGRSKQTDLAWLLRRFEQVDASESIKEEMFDRIGMRLRWTHNDFAMSRSGTRFPARPIFYQSDPLMRAIDAGAIISTKLRETPPLAPTSAMRVLDAARATLCARHRETDPMTYANEREITLLRLDRGIDVALFGMTPDERLPIESYFGYVAARNRVPMAYGGGWVLGGRCEIGVNIFDEFRGGESAYLFATILRAYRQHYNVERFFVDPYQFGAGNPEAIASGAFWFYYRLGFRPTDAAARRLAESEAARIASDRSYRTPPATLRRLAKSRIYLDTGPSDRKAGIPVLGEFDLAEVGTAVTAWIGRKFDGDLKRARKWSVERAMKLLNPSSHLQWSNDERRAFEAFSLLIGPIDDLARWSRPDRRSLGILMAYKGGVLERDFALATQHYPRLVAAVAEMAETQARW